MRQLFSLLLAAFIVTGATARAQESAYIIIDVEAGTVLDSNQSGTLWHPASVTKLMTAYLTFQALRDGQLKPTSPVRISAHALNQAPSKMGFKVGTVMNVDNALKMMLVKSANDIAMALAETVGGTQVKFAEMMNAQAARLGMASTHYNNPHGLPDNAQLTTARDQAVLARALLVDFPQYAEYFAIPAIKAGKRILRSQNKLLEQYRGTTGMKTGFICSSGYNIVASARKNGRSVIAVVLGATSSTARNEEAARLLARGFTTWGDPMKPKLAAFQSAPATVGPVDMRSLVCGKNRAQDSEEQETADKSGDPRPPALGPRFVLMDPVPVFTGRADADPNAPVKVSAVKATAAANVPLPRLRPGPAAIASDAPAGEQGDAR